MKSFKNLLDRRFPRQWHLVLVYRDEEDTPRSLPLMQCRTKSGACWHRNNFARVLSPQSAEDFIVMRMR
jgi:hypothetical protein